MRVILASASPRREELLRQVGLDFDVMPSGLPEQASGVLTPAQLARELAAAKAAEVAARVGDGIVIAADTVVVVGAEVLGKPTDAREAAVMLARLQGRTHRVVTGLAVQDAASGRRAVAHEETVVTMRPLTEREIAAYVASGEPLDKAGAYAVQGLGALLVTRIEGDYSNVVGLPLARLGLVLKDFGVSLLDGPAQSRPGGMEDAHPADHQGAARG